MPRVFDADAPVVPQWRPAVEGDVTSIELHLGVAIQRVVGSRVEQQDAVCRIGVVQIPQRIDDKRRQQRPVFQTLECQPTSTSRRAIPLTPYRTAFSWKQQESIGVAAASRLLA